MRLISRGIECSELGEESRVRSWLDGHGCMKRATSGKERRERAGEEMGMQ